MMSVGSGESRNGYQAFLLGRRGRRRKPFGFQALLPLAGDGSRRRDPSRLDALERLPVPGATLALVDRHAMHGDDRPEIEFTDAVELFEPGCPSITGRRHFLGETAGDQPWAGQHPDFVVITTVDRR